MKYLQKLINDRKDGKEYQWLEEYKNNCHKKHKIKHLVCGNEYEIRPYNFKQNTKCPYCTNRKSKDYLQKLIDERIDGKEYEWLEKYKGISSVKHKIKHLVCGNEYEVRPNRFQQNNSCPYCAGLRIKETNYLQKLIDNRVDGKEYQWLDECKRGNTQIKHKIKHLVCGNEYEVFLSNFRKGDKCPFCTGRRTKNYLEKIINDRIDGKEYQWLEKYKGKAQIKHKIKHLVCGHEYEVRPNCFQQGKKCPECTKKKMGKNFIKPNYLENLLLESIKKDGHEYEWLEKYKENCELKHKIKHLVCGNIFFLRPKNFKQGNRCPRCKNIISDTEIELLNYIKKIYKGKILSNDRSVLKTHELDIFLPDLKLAFEFNGLYWHSEKFKDRNYHKNKMAECHEKGIRLIQIWENEWTNFIKRKIIKSKIKYLLNQIAPSNRIYARKCYIKKISKKKADSFLNNNHIQGKSSKYLKTYGMFYKETKKLVAVMTFAQGLANRGSVDIELNRYTTKKFHNIIGGFSKMLSFALNKNKWKELYSYADLRLSDGNLYESNGWKRMGYVSPDYYYFDKSSKDVFHKSLFKKSNIKSKFPEIYDEKLTEKEMMEKTKYLRIWDCGKIKYSYK